MSPFGNGLLQSLRTGGIQEMDREGGQWSLTRPPPPRSRRHVGTGPLGPVHGSGGGGSHFCLRGG